MSAPSEKAAAAQAERVNDLHNVLATESGRRFVWRLLELSGQFQCSMGQTPEETAFNEGRRQAGIALAAECSAHALDRFLQMQEEGYRRLRGSI